MPPYPPPHLLTFAQLGAPDIGYISVSENVVPPLPFAVQRVLWTYGTPERFCAAATPTGPPSTCCLLPPAASS